VETLGSVTVICSDKTGTLTRNEMTVRRVVAGGQEYEVTGSGYAPQGEFRSGGQRIEPADHGDLAMTLRVSAWCNNAEVHAKPDAAGQWEIVGDPTEAALLVAALKAGVKREDRGELLLELPFDSDRKAMSVVVVDGP